MVTRDFPERPVPAVAGIVFRGQEVLLVQRKVPPSAGRWSLPGGAVELGETLHQAVVREVAEETGLEVEPVSLVGVYDNIVEEGERVRFHYTLVDFVCRLVGGRLHPGSDAGDARWVSLRDLDQVDLTPLARKAIKAAGGPRETNAGTAGS
ncbi:MAG: NUDIX hydrolase [Thermoplasmata archaeon]